MVALDALPVDVRIAMVQDLVKKLNGRLPAETVPKFGYRDDRLYVAVDLNLDEGEDYRAPGLVAPTLFNIAGFMVKNGYGDDQITGVAIIKNDKFVSFVVECDKIKLPAA